MTMQLESSAFSASERIPEEYTGDGSNMSPPLSWSHPPYGTQSLALICEDPDAPRGIWSHWVLYNLPAETQEIPAELAQKGDLDDGARQGKNDFGKLGYGGPAPPPGKPHRYFFKLYAIDTILNLAAGATRAQVLRAIEGHVLDSGELMGSYGR
ncbi:MAG TPA: YbhB/YbcL family Raf kinase inhibitor-like protein [Planctomycetaceae bacterium]|nr:YbhB/YbcL family Raf kinase inhibitor-like protein [Planctomycetaceae bacterium]